MNGLLLIDKPKGWTSFDAVNYVRSVVARAIGKKARQVKVGHIGTLDPMATGLLVLCVGTYTKKVPDLIRHDKVYEAEITFGGRSSTGDAEGKIVQSNLQDSEFTEPSEDEVSGILKQFEGVIKQTPPQYSAIKVNGKRAYELARAGKKVELQPREVTIHSIELTSYRWPILSIRCTVGSGTYIRVLAEDIGEKLGVGAYLSGLRRVEIDSWKLDGAVGPKEVTVDNIRDKLLA